VDREGCSAFSPVDLARGLPTDYELPFMRLVMFGPPAAGKGTQARLLADRTGLNHISTGELFRDEIDQGTDLGETARTYIADGNLVPDEVCRSVARPALAGRRVSLSRGASADDGRFEAFIHALGVSHR
jgi:hypothetical protein